MNLVKSRYSIGLKVLFITTVIYYVLATFVFTYCDQPDTIKHSVLFIDGILHGRFFDTYHYILELGNAGVDIKFVPVYSPVCLIILGLFSFPLVILYELKFLDFSSKFFFYFVNIQNLLIVLLSAIVIYKIVKIISRNQGLDDNEKKLESVFVYLSCACLIYYALIIGQVELYSSFFSTLGLYWWIERDRKKFILFFALAATMKLYALIVFIPLVLIREKHILKIIYNILCSISLLIVSDALWGRDITYAAVKYDPSYRLINALEANQLFGASLFILLYLILCFYVYISERDDDLWGVYICLIAYVVMYTTISWYPYYIICLLPYYPIIYPFLSREIKWLSMLIESMFSLFFILGNLMRHAWSGLAALSQKLFLAQNDKQYRYSSIGELISEHTGNTDYAPIIIALYLGLLLLLAVILHPRWKRIIPDVLGHNRIHWEMVIRSLVLLPFICLLIYIYYTPPKEVLYDVSKYGYADGTYSIITDEFYQAGEKALNEQVYFDSDATLEQIELRIDSNQIRYSLYTSIYVELVDATNNNILAISSVGVNEVRTGLFTKFKMGRVKVKKDNPYIIRIKIDAHNNSDITGLIVTLGTTYNDYTGSDLFLNGIKQDYDIYMTILGEKDKNNSK